MKPTKSKPITKEMFMSLGLEWTVRGQVLVRIASQGWARVALAQDPLTLWCSKKFKACIQLHLFIRCSQLIMHIELQSNYR